MLRVQDVVLDFDQQPLLRGVNLEVGQGKIVCLLGPSGCGKTTLLRVISGLEIPKHGEVWFDGVCMDDIPVHQRGFGLMFQDFALFPHLDVAGNIVFGLQMQHVPPAARREKLQQVLALVGLEGFEGRDVTRLSGGEKQRVALARALAVSPRLLMLDEPLGALDAALRERLVVELRAIIRQAGVTAIYVTHDHHEAFAVADEIAIMNAGVIEQVGLPEAIYRHPETVFVAQFLGLTNVVPVLRWNCGWVETAAGRFPMDVEATHVLLHPEDLTLTDRADPEAIAGLVSTRVFLGGSYRLHVQVGSQTQLVLTTGGRERPPDTGEPVWLKLSGAALPLSAKGFQSPAES
jgi:ABC-type Fe3+/spermidine/putrescine transport system ATPase subunit